MIKQSFKSIGVMLKYARVATIVKLFELLITALMAPLALYFTQKLIDSISPFVRNETIITSIIIWASLLLVAMLFSANVNAFNGIQYINMKRKLNQNFTKVVINKYKKLDYSCFEDSEIQDTLARMGDAPQEKIFNLFLNITGIISMLISIVGLAIIFMQVSIWFSLAFLAILIFMMWLDFKSMDMMNTMFNNQTEEERRLSYLSGLLSDKSSLFELRIFGAVSYISAKWYKMTGKVLNERLRTTIKSQKYSAGSSVCILAWIALVVFSLIYGIDSGAVTVGLFVSLVGATGGILTTTETLSHSFSNLSQRYLQMEHYDIFMALPEISDNESEDEIKNPTIKFEDVVFTYPKTEKKILNGITFTIEPNERMALVGENGAGKSTIIKLLCRLYKPNSGKITINSIDINDLSQKQLRSVLSVVFQDFANYFLTLRENVAFGNIGKLHDNNAIKLALSQGLAEGIGINAKGDNLDMNLGKLEENGVDLSGGQWQRVAIARACIADSSFVILDEPTASLDPVAESEMYHSFAEIMKNKGCIMISHRLASAKMCDKIIVLDGGRVTQQGSHEVLMQSGGLYAKMFSTQSAWYSVGMNSNIEGGEELESMQVYA